MHIEKLYFENLRNYQHCSIDFCPNLNIIYGANGTGKTTILEAISIASVAKSFINASESSLINYGNDYYQISAVARTDLNTPYKISIKYKKNQKKQISTSYAERLNPKDIIGNIPTIVLSPDFKEITAGSPQSRRQFMDYILCQTSKIYLEELLKNKKALKQRNNLLLKFKQENIINYDLLDIWTKSFITSSAEIIMRRNIFVNEFRNFFINIYNQVSQNKETIDLEYVTNFFSAQELLSMHKEEVISALEYKAKALAKEEIRRTSTLFGPQKDDIKIIINSGIAKEIASQGQHKSLLIALKFAEFEFVKSQKQENPIILLDDIFSELDKNRTQKTLELITNLKAQTFITLTELNNIIDKLPNNIEQKRYFYVENANVSKVIG